MAVGRRTRPQGQSKMPKAVSGRQWPHAGTCWRSASTACCRVTGRHRPSPAGRQPMRMCTGRTSPNRCACWTGKDVRHGPEENAGIEEAALSEDSPGVSDPELSDAEDLPENPATAPAAPEEEPAPSESDPAAPPTEGTTPDGAKPEEPSVARRLPTTTPAPGRGTSTARATKPTPTTPSPSASRPWPARLE